MKGRPHGGSVSSMQTTYVMVKPDGVQRGLVGEIIGRFEGQRSPISWIEGSCSK